MHKPETPTQPRRRRTKASCKKLSVRPGVVLFDPKVLEISGDWRQSLKAKLSEGNQEDEGGQEDNQQTHENEAEDSPGAKQKRMRTKVLEEICDTEKTYVSDIRTLHDHYIVAFEINKHPIMEDAQIAVFFNNLRHLVMLNSKLMTDIVDIVERKKEPQRKRTVNRGKRKSVKSPIAVAVQCEAEGVGAIFCRYAPLFKLYGGYAKDYEEVAQRLQNYSRDTKLGFSQFLEACREKSGSSKLFESLLIMPIQRIPRYKMLLERLSELTPAEHPDAAFLTEAVTRVRDAASLINETVRRQESLEIVIQAQQQLGSQLSLSGTTDRRLLKSGKLTKMSTKRQEEVMIHLFNDMMLYSGVLISGGYRVRRVIYLHSKAVGAKSDIPSTIDGLFEQQSRRRVRKECGFVVTSREKTFVLFAESPEAQREWVDAITSAVSDAQKQKEIEVADTGEINANDLDSYDGPADAAALWVPDEFAGACTNCNASFRVYFRRKHHCRRCGGVVCASCSSKRAPLFVGESVRVERVCTPCFKVLDLVRQVAMHWLSRVVEFRGVLRRRRLDKWTEHYYELRAGVLKQFTIETAATNATNATSIAQNGSSKGFNGSGNGGSTNGAAVGGSKATRRCTDELALAGAIVIHRSDSRAHKNRFCFQISTSEYDDLDTTMENNNGIAGGTANTKQKASPIYRRFSQPSLRPQLMSKISPLKQAVSRFGDAVSRGREPESVNPPRQGMPLASPPPHTTPALSPSASVSASGSHVSSSSSSSAAPHESEWILCASSIQDEVAWRVAIQRSADKALHRMRRSCITECPEPLESSLSMSLPPNSLRASMSVLSGSSFVGASAIDRRRASSLDRGRATEPELSQELVSNGGDDHITCLLERRRLRILKEIIRSEESYVECLGECIQTYVQPLLLRQLEGRQMSRQKQSKRRSSLRPVIGPSTPSSRHGISAGNNTNRRQGSNGAVNVSRAVGSTTSLHTMISASYTAASNSLSSTSPSGSKMLIMDADMSIFFSSVDQIYTLNQQLLEHLSRHLEEASATPSLQRDSDGADIPAVRVHRTGAIFHAYAPLLQLYTSYASRHSAALTALDSPQFADFLRELPEDADVNRLRRYLNMPVERIPRYKMLLEELLGSTPPEHVDYAPLQSAIRSVDRVASKIEEICERRDNSRALISVSAKVGIDLTGRTFVRDGMLRKVCRSKVQKYYFVLLEDAVVYGRQSSGLHKKKFRMIDLWECKVSDDTESMPGVITTDLNSNNAFCFYSPLKSFILLADSEEDKKDWTSNILDCIGRNLRGQTHPRSGSVPSEILGENDDDSSSGFEQEGFVIKNGWLNVSGGAVSVIAGTNGISAKAGPSIVGKKPRRLWITLTLQTLTLGTIFKITQPEESIAVELCDVSPLKHEKCFRLQFLYDTKLRDQTTYVFEAQSLLEREEWVRALKHCISGGDELALRRRSINAAPLAPIFMFDKVSNVCTICTHSFAVYRPRHHCRLCGSLVCGKCSKRRWTLSYSSSKKASRICDNCAKSTVSITRSFGESPKRTPVRFAGSE